MATVAADIEQSVPRAGWDFEPHPWRRYGARVIDITIFSTVFFVIFGFAAAAVFPEIAGFLFQPPTWFSLLINVPLGVIAASIGVAFCHAWWGSTPGKWIFRLRIETLDGRRLSLGAAFVRECYLVFWGYAFGLPLLSLLTLALSYSDLDNDRDTRWDKAVGGRPLARTITGAGFAWLIVGATLAIGAKCLGLIGLLAGK